METNQKITVLRTVSKTVRADNGADTERTAAIAATVELREERGVTTIADGEVRGLDDSTSVIATFRSHGGTAATLNIDFYGEREGLSRADILAAVETFIEDINDNVQNL